MLASALVLSHHPVAAQPVDPATAPRQTLYYIPHTHWEGAVFKTREGYLEMGLQNILHAIRLLKAYPDYKFTLDQVAYFKPFLERYPEEEADFRKFIAEGRLQIVGGMDVMPDDVKPGGELFVRQMQYGKQYCREKLGVEVKVAWLIDTFGHHPQLPQLLRLAGYNSFWFSRGVPNEQTPSEFRWQGIDGTEIPAFWLPHSYGLFYGPPRQFSGFKSFFQQRFDALNSHVLGPERVGLAGADVSEPEDYAPPLVRQFNASSAAPFTIRYAVPTDFESAVAKRPHIPVLQGDFNPIFQGTYSSRIELKQRTRNVEQLLLTAEKLDVLSQWLGAPSDTQNLWRAWEPVLFNQTHDLASGVMTDVVYEDTVRGYDFAERLAGQSVDSAWTDIAASIDTTGEGLPIIVFNPSGWPRSDIAEVEIGFAATGVQDLQVSDADGTTVPFQLLQSDRYHDGGLKLVTIAFLARDVPALGYTTYHAVPLLSAHSGDTPLDANENSNVIENEFYKLGFKLETGEITSAYDKSAQWESLASPANVIARQLDKGDLWELYRGLDGGSHIAMTNQQPVPKSGQAQFSSEFTGTNGVVRRGPVFSEFSVSHPLGSGSFATRVRLYHGLRRIDVQTQLVNNEKWVRYQALFPTTVRDGRNTQEIPFGAVDRPTGIEFPAQNWTDYSDGHHGVALLNLGLPGNLVSDGTLMLSLMRSHNLGQYGYGGGYEPGMSSETGFELGKKLTFHYALVPHAGDWRDAGLYRAGLEFIQPLLVRKSAPHSGTLPKRWGLVQVSHPNVVLSACKPGFDRTTVLRVYEASGQAARGVRLRINATILAVGEANLIEDSLSRLKFVKDTIQFDLHPFEIKTIKLKLKTAKTNNH